MERRLLITVGVGLVAAMVLAVAVSRFDRDGGTTGDATPPDALFPGARQRAQDRAAQSNLRLAMTVAKVYFVDNGSYSGFDADWALELDASVGYVGDEPATVDVVSINLARGGAVVMSTMSESGQAFCIADDADAESGDTILGTVDAYGARSAQACSGGWD